MLLALTIFWVTLNPSFAADEPQLSLGDKISVFSDKAYRKGGKYFEAVGNVVILSGKDTVYGELASLNQETLEVKIEGNVRFITKDLTLYGSHLAYNIGTGKAIIKNARILTSQYNLVATELVRVSETEYIAKEAEFTTCKDCVESWSVFGKFIRLKTNEYVQIRHGLAKIKGINVLYIPYIVLPILGKRETGILIPKISQRAGEGISFAQPFFWAIDDYKDATIEPTFWGKRGYGADLQYRQQFGHLRWMELNGRFLNDSIYEPGKTNVDTSGRNVFRDFIDLETHQQWNANFGTHIFYTDLRDLDMIVDFNTYTDPRTTGSDHGLNANTHYRSEKFSLSVDALYRKNQLISDAREFDDSYVQTLPRVSFSLMPQSLVQSDLPGLQHIMMGFDSSYTRFRQVDGDDSNLLRNADRAVAQPYLQWNLFNWGPVSFLSRYQLDLQSYKFEEPNTPSAGKNAGLMRTELSFSMDKIFGLAYEQKVPLKNISESDLKRLRDEREQGLSPIQKNEKSGRLVGELPEFEAELTKENIVQTHNSYRHSQEFKFIHHYIVHDSAYGNERFLNQIDENQNGWFDYEDAYREQEFLFGANTTKTIIPPKNTIEFQWNNTLIRKSPKSFSFLEDDRYLRDNFNYQRVGHFNISQGYLLNKDGFVEDDLNDRLTRFMLDTSYSADRWTFSLQEFYFHKQSKNIHFVSATRRFDYLNVMGAYRYEGLDNKIKTLSVGAQVRPTDILGLAMVKQVDYEAGTDVSTIYSADIMPHNNCWIFNLNYQQRLNVSRYSMNVIFNFGQEGFERYRNDYFAVKRL